MFFSTVGVEDESSSGLATSEDDTSGHSDLIPVSGVGTVSRGSDCVVYECSHFDRNSTFSFIPTRSDRGGRHFSRNFMTCLRFGSNQ